MTNNQNYRIIRVPRIIKATYKGLFLLIALALLSGATFALFEGRTLGESLYWAIITMTTVGYGDFFPKTSQGQLVSIFLACCGILLYGYIGAVIMTVQMESSLSGVFGMKKCKFDNHFVICGWTPISEVVLKELLSANRNVAVITERKDDVPIIKRMEERGKVFPIYGDPSKTEILDQAKIRGARVVILSMDDDSKNLITALHIKELNPAARIIVKTSRPELKKTMRIAGVTYVVTPHEMAGRLIASAAFEPEVANFVEDVTTATDIGGYDLQQYTIPKNISGTVAELSKNLKHKTDTTLIAIARRKLHEKTRETRWEVYPNPPGNVAVKPGEIVILLGNESQFKKVREYLGTSQGR